MTYLSPAALVVGGGQVYKDPKVMAMNISRYLKVGIQKLTFAEIVKFAKACNRQSI